MVQAVNADEIRKELESILGSDGFQGATKLQRFLRHVVEQALSGHTDQIKESVIGFEVYQKPASYDPRLDATVRVEASKLRHRLEQYYETIGKDSTLRITIPKGSYVPKFEHHPAPVQPQAVTAPKLGEKPAPQTRGLLVAGVLLSGVLLGWILAEALRPPVNPPPARMIQLSDLAFNAVEPALAPDGAYVVYASDRNSPGVQNLWRQPIDGGNAIELTRLPRTARSPAISADGKQVAFRYEDGGGVLALIPAEGGEITPVPVARRPRDPRFAPAGRRLVYWVPEDEQTLDNGGLYIIDTQNIGVTPSRLLAQFAHVFQPVWASGGAHIAAIGTWQSAVPEKEYDVWTVEIGSGRDPKGLPVKTGLFPLLERRALYRNITERGRVQIGTWRDGWLYFSAPDGDGDNLYRIRLEEGRGISGEPQALTTGAGSNRGVRLAGNRMVFTNSFVSYNLYSAPLTPANSAPNDELRRHTMELGINLRASVDRAGRFAAWESRRSSNAGSHLMLLSLATGAERELGGALAPNRSFALISPDASRVAYQVLNDTRQAIYLERLDKGAGPPRLICDDCGAPSDWNSAGTHLLYITGSRPNGVGLLDVETGRKGALLDHPSYGIYGARYQVDLKGDGWMAFYADTGHRTRQIFVAPVKSLRPASHRDWIAVTDGAHWDLSPAWGPDGHTIFFVSQRDGQRCIWSQPLDPATRQPRGVPAPVRHIHSPDQTMMQSVTYRGAEALWVGGGRLFFSLDRIVSSVWLKE